MNAFLLYEVKVAALLAVFFVLYWLLLRRDTWFRLRRGVLLLSVAASFILPLCVIELHRTEFVPSHSMSFSNADQEGAMAIGDVFSAWIPYLYFALTSVLVTGMAVTAVKLAIELHKICRLIRHLEWHKEANGVAVGLTDRPIRPFSYLRYVVLSKDDFQIRNQAILAHEKSHIDHLHTLDLFFVNMALVIQWFNPFIWMLRRELVLVHEYEADEDVLSSGIDVNSYFQLLMERAVGKRKLAFVNALGEHGMMRNRFQMLARQRSSRQAYLKALYLMPVVAVSLAISARTVTDYVYAGNSDQLVIRNGMLPDIQEATAIAPIPKSGSQIQDVAALKAAATESVLYYVDDAKAEYDDLMQIDPSSVREITVVKGNDDALDVSEPETAVYVDLIDTLIKRVDDDVYVMYSGDDRDEALKEAAKQRAEATKAHAKALKEATAQRDQALKEAAKQRVETAKAHEQALREAKKQREQALKEAKRQREQALKEAARQREEALKEAARQREEALKEAEKQREEALKEAEKQREEALKKANKDLKKSMKSVRKELDDLTLVADTIHLLISENGKPDSASIRLTMNSDGSISNIKAYSLDSLNGAKYVLIQSTDNKNRRIVTLFKS